MYIIGLEQNDCEDSMTERLTGEQSPPKTFGGSATCEICNASFVWKRSLTRHLKRKHMDPVILLLHLFVCCFHSVTEFQYQLF
jgi:hypothetical protein